MQIAVHTRRPKIHTFITIPRFQRGSVGGSGGKGEGEWERGEGRSLGLELEAIDYRSGVIPLHYGARGFPFSSSVIKLLARFTFALLRTKQVDNEKE